eukprot:Hpha_TRINITY_DN3223_c0_g1::TRINITY_DN3223_c0_g1_i1::g.185953::m.185953
MPEESSDETIQKVAAAEEIPPPSDGPATAVGWVRGSLPRSLKALRANAAWPLAVTNGAQARTTHLLSTGHLSRSAPASRRPQSAAPASEECHSHPAPSRGAVARVLQARPSTAGGGGAAVRLVRELRPIQQLPAASQLPADAEGSTWLWAHRRAGLALPTSRPQAALSSSAAAYCICAYATVMRPPPPPPPPPPDPREEQIWTWILQERSKVVMKEEAAERGVINGCESDMAVVWWSRQAVMLNAQGMEDAARYGVEEQEYWSRRLVANLASRSSRLLTLRYRAAAKLRMQWYERFQALRLRKLWLRTQESAGDVLLSSIDNMVRRRYWVRLAWWTGTTRKDRRDTRNVHDQEYAERGIIAKEELSCGVEVRGEVKSAFLWLWVLHQRSFHTQSQQDKVRWATCALEDSYFHRLQATWELGCEEVTEGRRLRIVSGVLRQRWKSLREPVRRRYNYWRMFAYRKSRQRYLELKALSLLSANELVWRSVLFDGMRRWSVRIRRGRNASAALQDRSQRAVLASGWRRFHGFYERRARGRRACSELLQQTENGVRTVFVERLDAYRLLRQKRARQRDQAYKLQRSSAAIVQRRHWGLLERYVVWRPKRDAAEGLLRVSWKHHVLLRWAVLRARREARTDFRRRRNKAEKLHLMRRNEVRARYWKQWDAVLRRSQDLRARADKVFISVYRPPILRRYLSSWHVSFRWARRQQRLQRTVLAVEDVAGAARRATGLAAFNYVVRQARRRRHRQEVASRLAEAADLRQARARWSVLSAFRARRRRQRRRQELADAVAARGVWTNPTLARERFGKWKRFARHRAHSSALPRQLESLRERCLAPLQSRRFRLWIAWVRRRKNREAKVRTAQALQHRCRQGLLLRYWRSLGAAAAAEKRREVRSLRFVNELRLVARRWAQLRRWPDLRAKRTGQREQAEELQRSVWFAQRGRCFGLLRQYSRRNIGVDATG